METVSVQTKSTLSKTNPELIGEWDYEKNSPHTPDEYTAGSNKRVWWICTKGHSYDCSIYNRAGRNQGCPYCSGKRILTGFNDLRTLNPGLAAEWNFERNNNIRPENVSLNSHKKYWWKCNTCSNEWQATPNDRARGRSCPVCASKKRVDTRKSTLISNRSERLLSDVPELMAEWDYTNNSEKPEYVLIGSHNKVRWICSVCGNSWEATVKNRINGSGCPKCMKHMRTSFPEQAIFYYLSHKYPNAANSYTGFPDNSRMELDIYVPDIKTGIEYDGIAFHSSKRAASDMVRKYELCKENGIFLIRVSEFEEDFGCYDKLFVRKSNTDDGLDHVIEDLFCYLGIDNVKINVAQDRSSIMQEYVTSIREKSIEYKYPEKAKKWDAEKNNGLRPSQVNAYSTKKYWWRCNEGHSYLASPLNETMDTKTCPICSNHRVLKGFNDLAYKLPNLAAEWDYDLNSPVTPEDVIYTSYKKYWWSCPKGHKYKSGINNRYYGNTNCPYCSNRLVLPGFNDLATINPDLAKEWNYTKNAPLTPADVTPGSGKKVWWKCYQGHEWDAAVSARNRGSGCPYCSGKRAIPGINDLMTKNPELMSDWDYERNESLNPKSILPGSNQKVFWKCHVCGNAWKSSVASRTGHQKSGCPVCGYKIRMKDTRSERLKREGKDLCSLFPDLAREWDYNKNTIDPSTISPGTNIKVWWICSKGHSYQKWLTDRTGKHKYGCPYCSRSK